MKAWPIIMRGRMNSDLCRARSYSLIVAVRPGAAADFVTTPIGIDEGEMPLPDKRLQHIHKQHASSPQLPESTDFSVSLWQPKNAYRVNPQKRIAAQEVASCAAIF
ncbi:MAG: hypothetical protein WDN69_01335 [Aliidongia sp.]